MNIDETNFLLCDLLPCVLSQFPFSIYSFFLSSSRVYVHIYIYMYSYIQVELVNVHKFVYIKTMYCSWYKFLEDYRDIRGKYSGNFINIFSLSLSLSLFLSFPSLCNIFVECYVACWKRERSRKNGNKIFFLLTCICIKVIVSAGTSEILEWIVYFCLKRNKERKI